MLASEVLRVVLHTQSWLQLALMFCCIISPGCGPMELRWLLCWPLCFSGKRNDCLHQAAALQAAANSLDGIIDTVAVKHPLADYLNLLKVCCSPLHEQHLQGLSTRLPPHGSVQQRVWATRTPSLSPNWSYECAAAPSPRMGAPCLVSVRQLCAASGSGCARLPAHY